MSDLLFWFGIALAVVAVPMLCASAYLALLAVLARWPRDSAATKPPAIPFSILVPAHNEERGIARTVESLLALDYPGELRRVVVVADNCDDATATRAQEAGAEVMVRTDPGRRGKGYALEYAFGRVADEGWAQAAIVVDADTSVSPNLLWEFARLFAAGAEAIQADYGVRNLNESWRTRLMAIALALVHSARSLGRERIGLSAGLHGNGMAFSRRVLEKVPHVAHSIAEDLEYGLILGMAGVRVHYAGNAHVWGDMASGEKQSRAQRRRWEGGRRAVARAYVPRMLARGVRTRDLVLLDLAIDLLVPPLTDLVLVCGVGTILATAIAVTGFAPRAIVVPWISSCALLVIYVLRGVALSGTGASGLWALAWAPVYVVWKAVLAVRQTRATPTEWIRTARAGESEPPSPQELGGTGAAAVKCAQPEDLKR